MDDADYRQVLLALKHYSQKYQVAVISYCLMPNHWHLLVHPREDDALSKFIGWITLTHTQRLHAYRGTTGCGHVYQGRFKSFPVQDDARRLRSPSAALRMAGAASASLDHAGQPPADGRRTIGNPSRDRVRQPAGRRTLDATDRREAWA